MPQQRRAQLTRRAILIAAAEEFDRVGYDATSLNAILRRGGITKGAFYFHFSSKEDVAEALARLYRRYRLDVWHRWARRGLDPLSTAVGLTAEIASVIERDVVLRAGMVREYRQAGQKISPLLLELLRKAAEKGALRPGLDPDAAAGCCTRPCWVSGPAAGATSPGGWPRCGGCCSPASPGTSGCAATVRTWRI